VNTILKVVIALARNVVIHLKNITKLPIEDNNYEVCSSNFFLQNCIFN
jgi:hypothetical protein